MKIAIIGQQDFGKEVLEAFLARKDEVAGVFCAPEKPGAKADPLRTAAEAHGLKVFQFPSLRVPEAHDALKSAAPRHDPVPSVVAAAVPRPIVDQLADHSR
jgi:methionyl-tRNA formyltransferase